MYFLSKIHSSTTFDFEKHTTMLLVPTKDGQEEETQCSKKKKGEVEAK